MKDEPRDLGKLARRDRQDKTANPFEYGTAEHLEWIEGWSHNHAHASDYGIKQLGGARITRPIGNFDDRSGNELPDVCPTCNQKLSRVPTHDGYLNRICPLCDKSFGCESSMEND